MNYEQQKERYLNDAEFHNLVQMITVFLMEGKFAISELKDAVVFATIKFEAEHVRPLVK